MYGQTHLTVLPLRAEPRHSSELVTQLLYNETYTILEQKGEWLWVRCAHDGYEGWLAENQVHYINIVSFEKPFESYSAGLLTWDGDLKRYIPMGSPLYAIDNHFDTEKKSIQRVYEAALQFLNTPYLWGGRSAFGIDCSGLMQVAFRMGGWVLPRDASQQIGLGTVVEWGEHRLGDLAFFENAAGRIVHVGLVIGVDRILHGSGWVRINELTKEGIFHEGKQTHWLVGTRRIEN